jgi:hypothetical protein
MHLHRMLTYVSERVLARLASWFALRLASYSTPFRSDAKSVLASRRPSTGTLASSYSIHRLLHALLAPPARPHQTSPPTFDSMSAMAPAGGGPEGGCARMPVGTHPHLLLVGAGNSIAVPSLARLGARRGEIRRLRSADQHVLGSLSTKDV